MEACRKDTNCDHSMKDAQGRLQSIHSAIDVTSEGIVIIVETTFSSFFRSTKPALKRPKFDDMNW